MLYWLMSKKEEKLQLPNRRYEEITKIVIEMFIQFDVRNIPIDCYEIAMKMGIILKPYSILKENGLMKALEISDDGFCLLQQEEVGPFSLGQWYIFYNDSKPPKRIRFTLMHEIAHIVLDHIEPSDLAEAEANFFAKYALAPPPLVHKMLPDDYLELGNSFDLSNECAMHSFNYYKKWLTYGGRYYKEKELDLIGQFGMDGYLQ